MPLFFFFSCLIAVDRNFRTMLNEGMNIFFLCLISKKKFQLFTIKYNVSCGLFIHGLYYVAMHSLCSWFAESFISRIDVKYSLMLLLYILIWSYHFYPYVNVLYYIYWFTNVGPSLNAKKTPLDQEVWSF